MPISDRPEPLASCFFNLRNRPAYSLLAGVDGSKIGVPA
jgi:hypothetical protein